MQIIDLSQPIYSGMDIYPGDPKVEIEKIHSLKKEGWRLRLLKLGSHTGTHVNAFSHMDNKGEALDKTPLHKFFGKAWLVSITQKLPREVGLVFSDKKLTGNDFRSIIKADPPFIAVSIDCEFRVELERKLLKSGIVTFTDLVNLDKLPKGKQFMFYGFPLKIQDGDGSPVRAVAIVE